MDSITYNHETGGCAAKFHVNDGGLSTPHTNFGGGWIPRSHPVGVPFGRSGRGSLAVLRDSMLRLDPPL
jgi:hypothetical protein